VNLRVTILGSGTAGGTPRVGGDWGACDPTDPRNRRLRASILLETDGTSVLVDTSPDLRQQALTAGFDRVDAVLYTHAHADHAHGIDDLRFFVRGQGGRRIPAFGAEDTMQTLRARFPYVFDDVGDKLYPPIVEPKVLRGLVRIGALEAQPFPQGHGPVTTLGYRFGAFAYSTDVIHLPEEAFDVLAGVDTWVVDCLQEAPHPTHAHLALTLSWIERVRPRRAVLTHLNPTLDHDRLSGLLPAGVEPAYDGMVLEL